jgi:hypothetical protein
LSRSIAQCSFFTDTKCLTIKCRDIYCRYTNHNIFTHIHGPGITKVLHVHIDITKFSFFKSHKIREKKCLIYSGISISSLYENNKKVQSTFEEIKTQMCGYQIFFQLFMMINKKTLMIEKPIYQNKINKMTFRPLKQHPHDKNTIVELLYRIKSYTEHMSSEIDLHKCQKSVLNNSNDKIYLSSS